MESNEIIKNTPVVLVTIGVFLVLLKLFGIIQISWIAVLCPIWVPLFVFSVIALLIGAIGSTWILIKFIKYIFNDK